MDEATNEGFKRTLSVLVCYYDFRRKRVVVEHLSAVELVTVNTDTVYESVCNLFTLHDIPWENCLGILMDSCGVMRGSKTGLEVRLRKYKNPALLNMDGDICHHIHNAVKIFVDPYQRLAEGFFRDLHNDHKWSSDIRSFMQEICQILGVAYTLPDMFATHRLLSVYDTAVSTLRLYEAYKVLYYGFADDENRSLYKPTILDIERRHGVSLESRERLKEIWAKLRAKKRRCTKLGRKRKERLVVKLFPHADELLLTIHIYTAALPVLKEYVMLFQRDEPLIHKVHDKLEELFREFLGFFIKPQFLNKSAKGLSKLDLSQKNRYLSKKDMFLGKYFKDLADKCTECTRTGFFPTVSNLFRLS